MSKARIGTFEDLLDLASAPLRPVMARLREIVHEIDPRTCEVVRLGDRAATYGCGPRKMIDGYVYVMPHRRWVNLGFFRGASLSDPEGLLEGKGARMRHVKIRTIADADRDGVHDLVAAALAERRAAQCA